MTSEATWVVLLSGPSSSGKTSLARALQRQLAVPALLVEADRAFPGLPSTHPAWQPHDPSRSDTTVAFHRSVAAWAENGFHLIVDGSLPYDNKDLRDACLRAFAPYDLRIVGVRCSDAELVRREGTRPEPRQRGWAVRQAADIHDGMSYAAEVDTTARSSDDGAADVVRQLQLAPPARS